MAEVRFKVPGKDTPGYLRRAIAFAELDESIRHDNEVLGGKSIMPETVRAIVAFLVPFCETDEGVDLEEAIYDLSEEQFDAMLAEFRANAPKETNEGSSDGSKAP